MNFRDNTCRGTIQDKKEGRDWQHARRYKVSKGHKTCLLSECDAKFGIQSQRLLPFTIQFISDWGFTRTVQCLATVHWQMLKLPFSLQLESKRRSRAAVTDGHYLDVIQSKGERCHTIEGRRMNTQPQLHRHALPSTAQGKFVPHLDLTVVESSPHPGACWTLPAIKTALCCTPAKSCLLPRCQLPDATTSTLSKSLVAWYMGLLAPVLLLFSSCHKII